ncbi:membrane protein DedA with SNARE-associated domain [Xanthomonas sacchari]|uniref:hypothetical protein n=1 Tax=Xanthomonas sacchari TaxID=56458 RepID=UPI002786381E|nr:hypothetical protein [Xanthomonas sacchari]MDQ1093667.1 membrane protein DedA with SNARE-associated domain [Xanthomonas sacchari]
MTGARAIALLLMLALAAMGGLVGMLLAEGGLDRVCLALAVAPLLVGAGCWWRWRRSARAAGRKQP